MPVSHQARVVFPVDRPPIEHGVVTIEGERIVAVGTKAESGEVIDLGDTALLPGLVNAHTHLEFSNLRQPLGRPGMPLPEWIRDVIATRSRRQAVPGDDILLGCTECINAGTTSVGDIIQGYVELDVADFATQFLEVIGFSRARSESALAAVVTRLDELSNRGKTRIGLSPHAPYTVSPGLLDRLIRLAVERALPVAMHIAESPEELQLLRDGSGPFQELLEERSMWDADAIPPGTRPLDYLQVLADAPRVLVIHGNYLADDELALLGANRARMSLIYCPRTHAYFGHEPYPLEQALAAGVRVGLGTDSRASNPDLDLLAEMRYVARAHSRVDLREILRMGTLSGAESLGIEKEVGSLSTGKLANMIAMPIADDIRGDGDAVLEHILASDKDVSTVWMRGSLVRGM